MGGRRNPTLAAFIAAACMIGAVNAAHAQQPIGSTTLTQNQVTRELGGASGVLSVGDFVFLNEAVRTGPDLLAKLVFVDSTNLAVGPTSRVVLDRFVFEGNPSGEKVAVNLAKGLFRFTTGSLDKKAYTITTPTAAIGVRGTVLDIDVNGLATRVTLVEGHALVCPRRRSVSFDRQVQACLTGRHCDCAVIQNPGETALVKKVHGANEASLASTPVNFASLCSGDASLCSSSSYASAGFGGALCGR